MDQRARDGKGSSMKIWMACVFGVAISMSWRHAWLVSKGQLFDGPHYGERAICNEGKEEFGPWLVVIQLMVAARTEGWWWSREERGCVELGSYGGN